MNLTALIVGLTFFVQFNIMIGEKRLKSELQEIQRYGRNKSTVVNQTYINGGQYRSKFDKISDDKLLNRKVYQIAKKMLTHRTGTLFEDMYWIYHDTMRIVASETEQRIASKIRYSKKTKNP